MGAFLQQVVLPLYRAHGQTALPNSEWMQTRGWHSAQGRVLLGVWGLV